MYNCRMSTSKKKNTEDTQHDWSDMESVAKVMLVPGVSDQQVCAMYNQWAKKGYDQVCIHQQEAFRERRHLHEIVEELYFHFSLSVCVCVCVCVCVSVCLCVRHFL